jgi:hypothetical protein
MTFEIDPPEPCPDCGSTHHRSCTMSGVGPELDIILDPDPKCEFCHGTGRIYALINVRCSCTYGNE